MVLVRLSNNEINKVFDVPGVKRYLFVHGVRALVYDNEVIAMKNYLESKFEVDEQTKIGKTIDIPLLNQSGEIIAIEAKKCIVRLQMLGATMSFQLK
jgi:DNA primase large subunit